MYLYFVNKGNKMPNVIIFSNSNNGVSVCTPTGEISIEEVLAKDCPEGAIIVDDSILPQGSDAQFFDAWELLNSAVTVNFSKAQLQYLNKYNANALLIAQKRYINTLAGIPNTLEDNAFIEKLNSDRDAIFKAATTNDLLAIQLIESA